MSQNSDTHPVHKGERYTKAGRLLITSRQLMALNALLDTPQAKVTSLAEWQRLVRRYDERLYSESVWRIPTSWVSTKKNGARISSILKPRGREILDGKIPLHIHGFGQVSGIKEWLKRR